MSGRQSSVIRGVLGSVFASARLVDLDGLRRPAIRLAVPAILALAIPAGIEGNDFSGMDSLSGSTGQTPSDFASIVLYEELLYSDMLASIHGGDADAGERAVLEEVGELLDGVLGQLGGVRPHQIALMSPGASALGLGGLSYTLDVAYEVLSAHDDITANISDAWATLLSDGMTLGEAEMAIKSVITMQIIERDYPEQDSNMIEAVRGKADFDTAYILSLDPIREMSQQTFDRVDELRLEIIGDSGYLAFLPAFGTDRDTVLDVTTLFDFGSARAEELVNVAFAIPDSSDHRLVASESGAFLMTRGENVRMADLDFDAPVFGF